MISRSLFAEDRTLNIFDVEDGLIQNNVFKPGTEYFEILKRTAGKGMTFLLCSNNSYRILYEIVRNTRIHNISIIPFVVFTPKEKADWVETQIKDNMYDEIFFMSTTNRNIDIIKDRVKQYRNIKSRVQLMKVNV